MNQNFYDDYIIKKGDTLYAVSKHFNVNPELIALINGLNMNDYIYENQSIKIPKSGYSYYLTKAGDNLNDVLNLFKADYTSFNNLNNIILLDEGQLFAYKRV